MSSSPRSDPADGRALRSERSRRAIVQALLDLVGEGMLQPTAQQVAERAGVGTRTVFRHFSDMDTLYAEMNEGLRAELRPLLLGPPATGSIHERVHALVERRAAVFERMSPYKRSANQQRWRSAFLTSEHRSSVRELQRDLSRWLPELDGAPDDLREAVDLATSFESWERLRTDQRLGRARAESVVERIVLALVAAGPLGAA